MLGPILAIVLTAAVPAAERVAPSVCMRPDIGKGSAEEFVADALTVVRACGHEPSAYRLELHEDDPFLAAVDDREPQRAAVFRPIDGEPHYAIAVRAARPCVVSWIWEPERFTDWQHEVISRAKALSGKADRMWGESHLLDILVTESPELVGVEILDPESSEDPERTMLRVLMRKDDLSSVDSIASPVALVGSPPDSDGTRTDAWPRWRGPEQNGTAADTGVFQDDSSVLHKAWSTPLGPSYSGIVVSGGRVVTMFSDGEMDRLVALDAATGREIWRYEIGAAYKGHQSAEDGPRSTPVIQGDAVYGLGPRGELFAVDLKDGSRIWSTDLRSRFGATPPAHGFTTSPLVEGNVLVVLAGGSRQRSLAGIDRTTGETLWTRLSYKVEYQSPVLMTLAGRRQIVIADRNLAHGLAPQTGEILWSQDIRGLGTGHGPQAAYLGGDRFLIKFSETIAVFELRKTRGGYAPRKLYRAEEFKKSYLPPIQHDGYLYGFNAEFLTCADAATGEEVWKSREPGGSGMILVDGHLVIFARDGFVVVARATPGGYQEKTRVRVLERDGLTWPSFAEGRIYVRNMDRIGAASVDGALPSE